jgi:hypothetical protein
MVNILCQKLMQHSLHANQNKMPKKAAFCRLIDEGENYNLSFLE